MPDLPSLITLPYKLETPAPAFESNYIKTPESLPRHFIRALTKPGARVFDPFAGLGTTLFVAEELGRIPYGIEAEETRQQWVAGQMENWLNLIHGDTAKAATYGFPKMDLCLTSPPYMAVTHTWNPLHAGNPRHAGYAAYLKGMEKIFGIIAGLMKKSAPVIVQADNIEGARFTPLIRDLSLAISAHLRPAGEVAVVWKNAPKDRTHTTCLIFKKA